MSCFFHGFVSTWLGYVAWMRDFTRGTEISYPWVHVSGVGFITLFFHHSTLLFFHFCVMEVGFEASVCCTCLNEVFRV